MALKYFDIYPKNHQIDLGKRYWLYHVLGYLEENRLGFPRKIYVGYTATQKQGIDTNLTESSLSRKNPEAYAEIRKIIDSKRLVKVEIFQTHDDRNFVLHEVSRLVYSQEYMNKQNIRYRPSTKCYDSKVGDWICEQGFLCDLTNSEIADALGVSISSVSKAIRFMEKCGIITRETKRLKKNVEGKTFWTAKRTIRIKTDDPVSQGEVDS